MVSKFLAAKLPTGKSMEEWMYMELPEMLDRSAERHKNDCESALRIIAKLTGDREVGALCLEDGSLDRNKGEIEYRERISSGASDQKVNELLCTLKHNQEQYAQVKETRDFMLQELMPTLKYLKDGKAPRPRELKDIKWMVGEEVEGMGEGGGHMYVMLEHLKASGITKKHYDALEAKVVDFFGDLEEALGSQLDPRKHSSALSEGQQVQKGRRF
jgi:hypothetical protein